MAIDINEMRLPITVNEACNYLQKETDNFGIFFDVDRCYELCAMAMLANKEIRIQASDLCHTNVLFDNRSAMLRLYRDLGVSGTDLKDISGKDSLTNDIRRKIIDSPLYSDQVKQLAVLQGKYNTNKRNNGYFRGIASLPQVTSVSKYGSRMSLGRPQWGILSTSRIASREPNVQGVPRAATDIITEPKGYTLLRCDSGQIEPRINFSTFLRDELIKNLIVYYKDAYAGLLHYVKLTDEKDKLLRQDFEKNFVPMEMGDSFKDHRQTIKRMTNAGSYGSGNLDNIDPELGVLYEKRILKHPARLALERKVTEDVEHGVTTFYGIFGTPVTPDSNEKYSKSDSGWRNHLIRCGINNIVQATASELMLFSIAKAREVLAEAKDTHIAFYKHDEACFYISDYDMEHGIGDKLSDITAYNVRGWIPIEAEPEWGVKHTNIPTYLGGTDE